MSDERLWHGGVPGLKQGDLLLPPDATGIVTSDQLLAAAGLDLRDQIEPDRMRRDRVYLTRDRDLARAYAACWTHKARHGVRVGHGALYVARPVGEWQPDPDLPDHSIECERAEIVAVYDAAVTMPQRWINRVMLAAMGGVPS